MPRIDDPRLLAPSSSQPPCVLRAMQRIAAASEPAPGSVRAVQALTRPDISSGRSLAATPGGAVVAIRFATLWVLISDIATRNPQPQ